MNKRLILPPLAVFLFPALLSGSIAYAASIPNHAHQDSRIQYVDYDPDNVVKIRAKIGHTVTVQLDKSEDAEKGVVAMGDAQAWNMAVKQNNLIFKPTATSPATNLTVITDKRTYVFDLSLTGCVRGKKKRCVDIQQPTYLLRFHYPTEEEKARRKRVAQQERALNMMVKFGLSKETAKLNYLYYGKGDKAIAPSAIWDDGRFTYIQYADNRDLPAVYKINPDGSEMLVNSHMEEDVIVVHETAPKLVIRLGESVLGVENKGYKTGSYNRLKTNQPDAVRINKGAE